MPREELLSLIVRSLVGGAEKALCQIAIELFLAENSVAKICDDYIVPAFQEVARRWERRDIEVFQERQASKMSQRILSELRMLIPNPSLEAPLAIGAAPQGDFYSLPSMMVELTLRDCGWQSTSMAENVPLASLFAAIQTYSPKIFWLSVSHLESKQRFVNEFTHMHNQFCDRVTFILGGNALTEDVRAQLPRVSYGQNLYQMTQYVNMLAAG